MIACTSPAFTARSRPLRISLPSISTCRFLISNSAIKNSSLLFGHAQRRLFATPTPAPFAFGLAPRDFKNGDNDPSVNEKGAPKPRTDGSKRHQPQGRGSDDHHGNGRDRPALPGHRRRAVAELLGFEPIGVHGGHALSRRCLRAKPRSTSAPRPRIPSAIAATRP